MSENISDWLDRLGLGEYAVAFAENKIDWEVLPELTGDDLKEIGVKAVGDRRKLLSAISQIIRSESDGSSADTRPSTAILQHAHTSTLARPAPSRRQVTVLFADLVGFTTLTSSMDAEDVHSLLNRYFEVVDAAVVRYGGRIDKHIGDAVMAVFGAPVAHTNDPERALRAALEIHEVVSQLDPPLQAHVGVASGQVIASTTGSDAHEEYTVTGDGVNLASRLTDMASIGETFASQAVKRAVGEMFVAESRGECSIKGLTEPMEVWRISGLSKEPEISSSDIFGRAAELSLLTNYLELCRTNKCGRVLILRGEPGIGKSRLLMEIGHLPEAKGYRRLRNTVLDFGTTAARTLTHSLARGILSLESDADEHSRSQLVQDMVETDQIEANLLLDLNRLLDLPFSPEDVQTYAAMDNQTRTRGRRAVLRSLIELASRENPILIEVEDVHWADAQDFADIGDLAATIQKLPVVIVMTTRRAEDPLSPDWIKTLGGTPLEIFDLEPLDYEDAQRMAEAQRVTDPSLLKNCIDRAAGNPLFLQQLLSNVDKLTTGNLPDSIQGIVQARLDGLEPGERSMLQAAAVLGQQFDRDALRFLMGDQPTKLDGLLHEALLFETGNEIKFAHALIRDGAYESLMRSQREELHRKAAEWYADRDLALHAKHLDRANAPQAAAAYLAAAEQLINEFEHNRALPLLERAVELKDSDHKFEIMCAYGEVLRAIGESGRAQDVFSNAAASAEGDAELIRAHVGLAQVARQASLYEQALDSLAVAQEAAERLNAEKDLALIHYLQGNLYFPLGRIDEMLSSTELAIAYADKTRSIDIQVGGFSNFGDANYMKGAMRTADGFYTRAINLAREHSLNRHLAANLHNRAAARLYLCESASAKDDAEESLALSQKYFAPVAECVALAALSAAVFVEGDNAGALQYAEDSMRLGMEIGAQRFEAQAKGYATRIFFLQGRVVDAQAIGKSGADLALSAARNFTGPKELSAFALTLTDTVEQDRLLTQGEEILGEGCVSHCHFFFYSDAMRIMLTRGDWDSALNYCKCLEDFTHSEPLPLTDLTIRQTRLLVELGRNGNTKTLDTKFDEFRAECSNLGIKQTLSGLFDSLPC